MKALKKHLLAGALLLSLAAPALAQDSTTEPKKIKPRNQVLKETFADVAAKTQKTVVKITANGRQLGYGVSIEGGFILTAASVVKGRDEVDIVTDDSSGTASLVARDNRNHIALLKSSDAPKTADFGSSDKLFIGQFVITVGHADLPLAAGCVSAKNRRVTKRAKAAGGGDIFGQLFGGGQKANGPKHNYKGIIQHDSKIKPGMYGSPVFDAKSQLVGINVEKAYRGSSYLVGIDDIRRALPKLQKGENLGRPTTKTKPRKVVPVPAPKPDRGYLGVSGGPADAETLKRAGEAWAFLVEDVNEGSGAAKAGLQKGDLIIGVDGQKPESWEQFVGLMGGRKLGDIVTLKVQRGDAVKDFKVSLGARPK